MAPEPETGAMPLNDGLDPYSWAMLNGIVNCCPEHNVFHDSHLNCPECGKPPKRDIFAGIIWPYSPDGK